MKVSLLFISIVGLLLTACVISPAFEHANNGDLLMEKSKYNEAIDEYSKAIELDPDFPEIKSKLAVAYNNRGTSFNDIQEWDKAIADFNMSLELDSELFNAYNNRGTSYIGKGQEDEATAFEYKYQEKSYLATEYFNKAIEKFTLAIDDKKAALNLNPKEELYSNNLAVAYNERGEVYNEKEEWDLAVSDFTNSIGLNSNMKEYYNNRGHAYNGKSFSDQAIVDLNRAIQLDPEMSLAYSNRSWSYYEKEEYDQAITDATRAIELEPDLTVAYMNRGNSYFQKGMMQEAKADFQKVLELTRDPEIIAAANKVLLIIGSR